MKKCLAAMIASLSFLVLAAGCAAEPSPEGEDEVTSSQAEAVTTCGEVPDSCSTSAPCCPGLICRAQYGCSPAWRCPKFCFGS